MKRGRFYQPWTVGDMDRVEFMRRNRSLTAEQFVAKFKGTAYQCDIHHVRLLVKSFNIPIRPDIIAEARA